jgi:CBS domain-containing protein
VTLQQHAERTEKEYGLRAIDIHKWLDGYFDAQAFDLFLKGIHNPNFDPYDHRKHRHCREALDEAYEEFEGKYTKNQIRKVFEMHVMDDYNGYIPCRNDFESGAFKEKYHEQDISDEKILTPLELREYFRWKHTKREESNEEKLPLNFIMRIIIPTILTLIMFILSIFVIIVPIFRSVMMQNKRDMIKELVNTAASSVSYYIQEEQSGRMSQEEAKQSAFGEVRKMRYGIAGKDYFFITDMHPRMLMHPYRSELEGRDLTYYIDTEDTSGKYLFVEFVELVEKSNEGYLYYYWQWMDESERQGLKLSYVQGIEEWGWIIGTGIYINDVEEEIGELTVRLLFIFGIISAIIFAVLLSIIYYSRKIEQSRLYYQKGLREAKDRYRALAEASTEGYVLEVEGENVYLNGAIQRMLGYSESELLEKPLWNFLDETFNENTAVKHHLQELYNLNAMPSEFEARFITKSGELLNVNLTTSNLFFSHKNGHLIKIKPIRTNREIFYTGMIRSAGSTFVKNSENGTNQNYTEAIHEIIIELVGSTEEYQIIKALNRLPKVILRMITTGVDVQILRDSVSTVYTRAFLKAVEMAQQKVGESPGPFAMISLGSNARGEMTLFSDQDNALIFESKYEDQERYRAYFIQLAGIVNGILERAGYHLCPGGIIASNPECCLSLTEWKESFAKWFKTGTVESIFKINVFLDIAHIYGEKWLTDKLQQCINQEAQNYKNFFPLYAQNALLYNVPLTVLGDIRTETKGDKKIINIKECLKPIEIALRLYALHNSITEPSTIARLDVLTARKVLQKQSYKNTLDDFNYLWNLRFHNQLVLHADLSSINDDLDIELLSEKDKEKLKNTLGNIKALQNRISIDFMGMMKF